MNPTVLIPVTKGKFAKVDYLDSLYLTKFKRHLSNGYAVRNIRLPNGKQTQRFMHTEVLRPKPGMEVDHKNRDRLDNRYDNLRHATPSQNQWNTGLRKDSQTGVKGVHWSQRAQRYRATIKANGKTVAIGQYESLAEAAAARQDAAEKLHGEFACATTMAPDAEVIEQVTEALEKRLAKIRNLTRVAQNS
jgi:hypothetical protein